MGKPSRGRRFTTGHYIAGLAVWTALTTGAVAALNFGSSHLAGRAVVLMGTTLVLLWAGAAGSLMRAGRDRVRPRFAALPGSWQVKFVLFCTLLALAEEAITVSLTNLAPLYGVPVGKAYITASANYLDVVCRHSVVVFAPQFVGWAWMLRRWDFHPNAVFLLYGLTGTLGEVSFGGPQHLLEYGMWTFVYGLMVYLPAYCLPARPAARRPTWWMYLAAVFIPTLFAIPVIAVVAPGHPKIHFPPIGAGPSPVR